MPNEETAPKESLAAIDSSAPGIRDVLLAVLNVSENGTYHEPSCPFCCSQHRLDAERLCSTFDMMVNNPEERISSYFASVGDSIPVDVIRNHMVGHMNRGDVELRKAEYLSRIATLSGSQMTTLAQCRVATAAVMECLSNVGVLVPSKGLPASKAVEIKASVVAKLVKTWVELMEKQSKMTGEMWNEGKMVSIPTSDFYSVFDDALKKARTPDERSLIAGMLESLTKAIQR